jgi:hypothetical protein
MKNLVKHHLPKYGIILCVGFTLLYLDKKAMKSKYHGFPEKFIFQSQVQPGPEFKKVKYKMGLGSTVERISFKCISY